MAQRVEVTVADIVRSFAKGVIGERIAVRKLEALMAAKYIEWYEGNGPEFLRKQQPTTSGVIHTDNL
jgi:hypothetical protein